MIGGNRLYKCVKLIAALLCYLPCVALSWDAYSCADEVRRQSVNAILGTDGKTRSLLSLAVVKLIVDMADVRQETKEVIKYLLLDGWIFTVKCVPLPEVL